MTMKRTMKAYLTLQATRTAGEDEIGNCHYVKNETGLFSRTVAMPYPFRECFKSECITATSTHWS